MCKLIQKDIYIYIYKMQTFIHSFRTLFKKFEALSRKNQKNKTVFPYFSIEFTLVSMGKGQAI